jgi:predicted dehydrogenase
MTQPLGVAIVGCGLIGRKRSQALPGGRLAACADLDPGRAEALAATVPGCAAVADWRDLVRRSDVEAVVVAVTHDALAEVSCEALRNGKHVLVEKPAARNVAELDRILAAAKGTNLKVRVGFNHRYHPGFLKAVELVEGGALGPLMYLRARYGHGGRKGYEREWRADPKLSGGGELIDQGVHLIDLSRRLLGELPKVEGWAHTYFWDMKVDDNAFLLLRTARDQAAFLHVSCSEWKNLFSLEVYGRDGKLHMEGLGGSYGVERLTYYRMLPQMGPPETTTWEYPMGDRSWAHEFGLFVDDVRGNREPDAGLADARAAMGIVERVYAASGYRFGE